MTADLDKISKLLSDSEPNQPCSDLDKQIIAAAHRELEKSTVNNHFQISWWRKISLPLYVATGFSLTVLAYNHLWPMLPLLGTQNLNDTAEIEISIERNNRDDNANYKANPINSSLPREKILLPQPLEVLDFPERTLEQSNLVDASPINKGSDGANDSSSTHEENFYTGNQLIKSEFPEKESWARQIISHMREGQLEQARKELRKFKEVYPKYPIEEQIKMLSR